MSGRKKVVLLCEDTALRVHTTLSALKTYTELLVNFLRYYQPKLHYHCLGYSLSLDLFTQKILWLDLGDGCGRGLDTFLAFSFGVASSASLSSNPAPFLPLQSQWRKALTALLVCEAESSQLGFFFFFFKRQFICSFGAEAQPFMLCQEQNCFANHWYKYGSHPNPFFGNISN